MIWCKPPAYDKKLHCHFNNLLPSTKGTVFFFSLEKFVATHSLNFGILCIFFFRKSGKKKIQVYFFFFPEILYASLTQHIFRRLCEIWPKFVLKLLISVDYCFFLLLCTWNVWGVPKLFKQYSGCSQNQLNKRGIDVVGHNNKSNGIWNKMIKAKLGYGHYGR